MSKESAVGIALSLLEHGLFFAVLARSVPEISGQTLGDYSTRLRAEKGSRIYRERLRISHEVDHFCTHKFIIA